MQQATLLESRTMIEQVTVSYARKNPDILLIGLLHRPA